jgi:hypothetical protein
MDLVYDFVGHGVSLPLTSYIIFPLDKAWIFSLSFEPLSPHNNNEMEFARSPTSSTCLLGYGALYPGCNKVILFATKWSLPLCKRDFRFLA